MTARDETEAEWHTRRERELAEATPASVRAIVVAHLDGWQDTGATFAWPDDGLARYGWQYGVHCWAITDWNKTGRAQDFRAFLRAWVHDDANIANALKDPAGWSKGDWL